MRFDYRAVEGISNQDFWGANRGILESCEKVAQDYETEKLRECLADSRLVLEAFIHYLYKRLTKNRFVPRQLGALINDTAFKVALDNGALMSAAERINNVTRKYHHPEKQNAETEEQYHARVTYEDEQEVPIAAAEVLGQLSSFLSLAAAVINEKIPGERGTVKLSLKDKYFSRRDSAERVLEAKLEDVDNYSDYERVWAIDGHGELSYTGRTLILRKNYCGKVIVFRAINKKTGRVLEKSFGPIEAADFRPGTASQTAHKPVETGRAACLEHKKGQGKDTGAPLPRMEGPSKPGAPKCPLLTARFLEAELAKERLKMQEDYDAEDYEL